mmetsp:Transcript_17907/g.53925  ORF Transcript_17907/g.53925 Transcript_17907/m.53925 type:complete len:197 (+) Transcript_17907:275-865(+)
MLNVSASSCLTSYRISARHSGSTGAASTPLHRAVPALPMQLKRPQYLPMPYPERSPCGGGRAEFLTATATQRKQRAAPTEGKSEGGQVEQSASSGSGGGTGRGSGGGNLFQNLIGSLLTGAASRLERGTTTCLVCRGTGTCTCPTCKGSGVLSQAAAAKMMKTAGLKTNRCMKCSGYGRTACPNCKGRGFRGDFDG